MPRYGRSFGLPALPSAPLTVQLATAREELARTRDQLREAEQRAAVAEQSARDAWRFAKALSGAGRTK